ncbi:vacuolar protein sorting 55 [Lactarius sanguifluus]|nr:vacuolar protein sorting 55 [Lactarius sanguifluus]
MAAGLKTVILLSFVLAVGFLMIILSCALWSNWLPLLVAPIDLGRFITAFIVVTGFSLPLVLAHSEIITSGASVMSLIGGGLVYGTILAYAAAFRQDDSEFE